MPNVQWIGAHASNYTYGRGGYNVDTIGIHYTATNASAYNNGLYFSGANRNASAHYFVDGSGTIIQTVSEKDTAWALGNFAMNCRAISIEVVSAGQNFSDAEIKELAWLVQDIMNRYGIPESRVIRHYDVTGKHCPAPYVNNTKWYNLREEICYGTAGVTSGWIEQDGYWWYKNEDGSYPAGEWKEIDGTWYLFDDNGWMLTGWQQVGDAWFYMNGSGAMLTGWRKIDGYWYLFGEDGVMKTGWQQVDGYWYLLNVEHDGTFGAMLTGWQKVGSAWFYMDDSGAMKTGWLEYGGAWYYLNGDGVMQTGWQSIDGLWYYFAEDGEMLTGWLHIDDKWYLLNPEHDGSFGAMKTDWQRVDDTWYFLGDDGVMRTGQHEIAGEVYMFGDDGAMTIGWKDGKFYNDLGFMARSEIAYDGEHWYAFDEDGDIETDVEVAEDGHIIF